MPCALCFSCSCSCTVVGPVTRPFHQLLFPFPLPLFPFHPLFQLLFPFLGGWVGGWVGWLGREEEEEEEEERRTSCCR